MKEYLNNLIFRRSTPRIILACKDDIVRQCKLRISSYTNTTYSHTVRILKELKNNGIIFDEKIGRRCIISLSEKGLKIANMIEKTIDLLNKTD